MQKKFVSLFTKITLFQNLYVISASMINRFEETIALKSLDQRKYLRAIFRKLRDI